MLILLAVKLKYAQKSLKLTSEPPSSTGSFCQERVQFTCIGTEMSFVLNWVLNGSVFATYSFSSIHAYPFPFVPEPLTSSFPPGVVVNMNDATLSPNIANSIDITATLDVPDGLILNRSSLHCEDSLAFRSNVINVQVSDFHVPQMPNEASASNRGSEVSISWPESIAESGGCSLAGDVKYILIMEDSAGRMMNFTSISSDVCDNGSCNILVSTSSQICSVGIVATNDFGSSDTIFTDVVYSRLTSTNIALLVLGVLLSCSAIAGVGVVYVVLKFKAITVSKISFILLSFGAVLSVILWVAVGFHVGLQDKTCDAAWQRTRDDLILSSFNFSIFSILLIVVASANLLVNRLPSHMSHEEPGTSGAVYDEVSARKQGSTGSTETSGIGIKVKANAAYQMRVVKKNKQCS